MLMSHVRYHVDNELPTVSHEDDERLGKLFNQIGLTNKEKIVTSFDEKIVHQNKHNVDFRGSELYIFNRQPLV